MNGTSLYATSVTAIAALLLMVLIQSRLHCCDCYCVHALHQPLMFPAAAGVQQSVNGTVLWSELTRHLSAALYTSAAEWCLECGNTGADVCLAAAAAASAAKDTASTATATGTASSGGSSSKTAIAAVFALLAGLVGGTVLGRVCSNCRMKRNGTGLIKQPYFGGGVAADEPHAPTRTGGTVS
jgi:hypothetical protein